MSKKTIEEIYQKKDLHEHVLDRPDSYIGTNKMICEEQYIFKDGTMVKNVIEYNPAFIKIFDEILVNAIDHTVRDTTATIIKVDISKDIISIYNNGGGIPVVKHKEHNIYIPEMIFGNLLTSSNYDDSSKRIVGGKNGLGGKLCNIYSKSFIIETVDSDNKKYYYQEFTDNMYKKSEPIIKSCTKKAYTKITFKPDYKRFGIKNITDDLLGLMTKRVYDCTACTNKNISVYLNGEKLKQKDFQQYISLFSNEKFIYEKVEHNEFIWEYAVNLNDNYQQVSFVNGVATTQGGRHVEYILGQIIKKLIELIQTKKKIDNIKPSYIRDRIFIFVRATIENPNFSSQSKENLTTPVKDFGIKVEVSDNFINKLYNSGIVEEIVSFTKYKNQKNLEKATDGKKKSKIRVAKLEDAHNAGTSKSKDCTLILTEGDSAKAFAVSGLSIIGRDNYGVFPLRGKLLNVREATQSQLLKNEEINNLKQIIGLQHNKKYKNLDDLRYGSIMILADQDHDGTHIKCLLVNMFHTWWPELLDIKGFIRSMKTPIVKAIKGNNVKEFYTIKDYKNWEKDTSTNSWIIKYYKGLGTSTAKDAKDIFKRMEESITNYVSESKNNTDKAIMLAFEKKQSDARKDWLQEYNFNLTLDQSINDVSYSELINKDLIHFSMYDVIRSIPSICDGFKPSQRKVIYTMFKKNYQKEIKVAQLGAAVSETTSYHHGETSLYGTIINMAQDYLGTNNMNLLKPNGQFGTRISQGKDAASPRYIFTELSDITKKIFNTDDFNILSYQEDDGKCIEPLYYIPVLPLVLVNGAQGIGTGYSTNIPCYNPKDIISNIKLFLKGKDLIEMSPWYKNFKGTITKIDNGNYMMTGVYNIINNKYIKITELPVGVGTDDYKEFLENLVEDNKYGITSYKSNSTEIDIDFSIMFNNSISLKKFIEQDIVKILKLSKSISTKNYHLLNKNGTITKYESAEEILKEFLSIRLEFNTLRKKYLLDKYIKESLIVENKIRFLKNIMNSELVIYKKSKKEIEDLLSINKFSKIENSFNYLISLPIYSFTSEKLNELNNNYKNIIEKQQEIQGKSIKCLLLDDLENLK